MLIKHPECNPKNRLVEVKILPLSSQYVYKFSSNYSINFNIFFCRVHHPSYKLPEHILDGTSEVRDLILKNNESELRARAKKISELYYKRDSFLNEVNKIPQQEIAEWIESRADTINWEWISKSSVIFKLPLDFIEKFSAEWDWAEISYSRKINFKFIERFKDKINWEELSDNPSLTWKIIKAWPEKIIWYSAFLNKKMSEIQIKKYYNYFKTEDWEVLSRDVPLSSEFIKEYSDKLCWYELSFNQTLNEDIISLFKDKIDWEGFQENYFIDKDFKKKMIKKYS